MEQLHQVYFGARQCRTSPSRSRGELVIRLIYLLGTRATETANLRWDDLVQLESGPAIHVRAETAKGGKERFIPIHQPVLDVLEALRLVQPASEWIAPAAAPRQSSGSVAAMPPSWQRGRAEDLDAPAAAYAREDQLRKDPRPEADPGNAGAQ